MRTLLALLALAACRDAIGPLPTATLTIGAGVQGTMEWPRNSGDTVTLSSSLDEQAGLAGLTVTIIGATEDEAIVLDAQTLKAIKPTRAGVTHFDVPDTGAISIHLQLVQDGEPVARGIIAWQLEPSIQWTAGIERSPYPASAWLSAPPPDVDFDQPAVPCGDIWCRQAYRIDISEGATNYPGEALWLTLRGVDPAFCLEARCPGT